MALTPEQIAALPLGTPVTLTLTADTAVRTWHMRYHRTAQAAILDDGAYPVLCHGADPAAQPWSHFMTLHAVADVAQPWLGLLPEHGCLVNSTAIYLAPDAPGWTVEPLTSEGERWASENEPPASKRDRLIEAVRALDPALASDLDGVIDTLISDAKDDARYAERYPERY